MRAIFLMLARAKESIYMDKHYSYLTTYRSVVITSPRVRSN